MITVNMSGDDLKSSEKRAADAALEKENMRVAMTATEQKAISTTYVNTQNPLLVLAQCHPNERDLIPHPRLQTEWVRYGVFLAFDKFYPHLPRKDFANSCFFQDAMWQVQGLQGGIHTGSDPCRR